MPRDTTQQAAILSSLERAPGPLLPEEVLSTARRRCRSLGQATVYRVLGRLVEAGSIQRVVDAEGRARFETTRGHHHHFTCRTCERVFDVEGCRASETTFARGLPQGFVLEGHEVWLAGLCAGCAGA